MVNDREKRRRLVAAEEVARKVQTAVGEHAVCCESRGARAAQLTF